MGSGHRLSQLCGWVVDSWFGTEIDTSCVTALLYRERFPPGRYLFRVFLEEVMTLNDGDVVNHWFYLVKVSLYSVLLEMFCNDLVKVCFCTRISRVWV